MMHLRYMKKVVATDAFHTETSLLLGLKAFGVMSDGISFLRQVFYRFIQWNAMKAIEVLHKFHFLSYHCLSFSRLIIEIEPVTLFHHCFYDVVLLTNEINDLVYHDATS